MTSLDKMLGILDLFDDDKVGVQLEDVMQLTRLSRATAYRYLQSLSKAGVLAPATGNTYVLGPRVIELDRLMRLTDPLLTNASPVMHEVAGALRINFMLCSYYGNKVMCADLAWPDESLTRFYERGRPMPMFRGAMAKVILSNLTPYQLRSIMLWHADEIRAAGLGSNWDEFRTTMSRMRKEGCVVTHGEVIPDLVGIGAPIFDPDKRVLGSLVMILREETFAHSGEELMRRHVIDAAARIDAKLASVAEKTGMPALPARPRRGNVLRNGGAA
ncbi:IclR family transcriptional regulator [Pseudochelatococcus lubricantis]|uniref:IclR family transcriptional regulator n=1 Tax=Pseudochelatococcus lubricantis TaxID=1538102 RepID=UPI0035EAFCD6